MNNEILNKLITIVEDLTHRGEVDDLCAETNLKDHEFIDSVIMAQILYEIEQEFKITISPHDAHDLRTLADMTTLIDTKTNNQAN